MKKAYIVSKISEVILNLEQKNNNAVFFMSSFITRNFFDSLTSQTANFLKLST